MRIYIIHTLAQACLSHFGCAGLAWFMPSVTRLVGGIFQARFYFPPSRPCGVSFFITALGAIPLACVFQRQGVGLLIGTFQALEPCICAYLGRLRLAGHLCSPAWTYPGCVFSWPFGPVGTAPLRRSFLCGPAAFRPLCCQSLVFMLWTLRPGVGHLAHVLRALRPWSWTLRSVGTASHHRRSVPCVPWASSP